MEAVEEAVIDSLLQARGITGHRGHAVESLPLDRLRELLERHGCTGQAPAPRERG